MGENDFCVLRTKARGHRDLVTVVGHAATISVGEWITASGEWVNDRTHGQQFRARFLRASAPTSVEGIEKYLSGALTVWAVASQGHVKKFRAITHDAPYNAAQPVCRPSRVSFGHAANAVRFLPA
jgi:hypothetical protein